MRGGVHGRRTGNSDFTMANGQWTEQKPLQEFVFGKTTNLVVNPFWIEDERRLVTLKKKNELRDQHNLIKSYTFINRESRLGID